MILSMPYSLERAPFLGANVQAQGRGAALSRSVPWSEGLGFAGKLTRPYSIGVSILIAQLSVPIAVNLSAQPIAVVVSHPNFVLGRLPCCVTSLLLHNIKHRPTA
jgi:hypothetical protein